MGVLTLEEKSVYKGPFICVTCLHYDRLKTSSIFNKLCTAGENKDKAKDWTAEVRFATDAEFFSPIASRLSSGSTKFHNPVDTGCSLPEG